MSPKSLNLIINRLINNLKRDVLIQRKLYDIREYLDVDRIVLYYFYRKWKGQVIAESVKSQDLSILGSTGADDCFNQEYGALYEEGRIKATPDIKLEPIHECHRDFLCSINVRANLVVPVILADGYGLWGLLIAHQCSGARFWTQADIDFLWGESQKMLMSPVIIAR